MRYFILLMIMLSSSCSSSTKKYRINGKIIQCNGEYRNYCGVSLWDCTDGISYTCLTNLEELL